MENITIMEQVSDKAANKYDILCTACFSRLTELGRNQHNRTCLYDMSVLFYMTLYFINKIEVKTYSDAY